MAFIAWRRPPDMNQYVIRGNVAAPDRTVSGVISVSHVHQA